MEARLSTFLTRFEARQQLAEAKGILEGHQAAHRELKGSPCMAAALQETLAIGNFLNWGTRLGPAAGFRLRNLPKLQVHACRSSPWLWPVYPSSGLVLWYRLAQKPETYASAVCPYADCWMAAL